MPDAARRQAARRPRGLAPAQELTLPDDFPQEVDLVACDLDRTLIAEDGVLRPRTRDALAAVRDTGPRVVIATGRMFRSVRPYLAEAALEDPVVCYQGAVVADPTDGRFLRHEPIPLALAREVIMAVEAEGVHVNCYVDDHLYVARHTPEAEAYASFQGLHVHVVGDLLAWLEKPPTKLVAVGEPRRLDALEQRMKAYFGSRAYISKSLPFFLEFASPEVTKASGLEFVAEHLGLSGARTIAFGDGENDVELLEWAAYSVAVANAHERVLAVADYVCPPVDEEGVAIVLEAFLASRSAAPPEI